MESRDANQEKKCRYLPKKDLISILNRGYLYEENLRKLGYSWNRMEGNSRLKN